MMHWDYGWGMGFGWLFMIVFLVLVILGVVFLIKLVTGGAKTEEHRETALDILKKRYASGEISKEEFEEKRKNLEARSP
jgi:putative membrane protein